MKYDEIPPINVSSGIFNGKRSPSSLPTEQQKNRYKDQIPQDKIKPSQLDRIQLSKLDQLNADSMNVSIEIRDVNQAIETISSKLNQMQTALEGVVKIYPPYPPGSSERIEALRQFSTLRKMIDQFAQPKFSDGLMNILGDPATDSRFGDWTMKMVNQEADIVIKHQPMHTGIEGLDIPEIPLNSSDQQILSTIDKITSAIKTVDARHLRFIADANRIIANIA